MGTSCGGDRRAFSRSAYGLKRAVASRLAEGTLDQRRAAVRGLRLVITGSGIPFAAPPLSQSSLGLGAAQALPLNQSVNLRRTASDQWTAGNGRIGWKSSS